MGIERGAALGTYRGLKVAVLALAPSSAPDGGGTELEAIGDLTDRGAAIESAHDPFTMGKIVG